MVSTLQDMKNTLEEQTIGSFVIPTDQSFMSGDSIVLEIWGKDGTLQGSYSFVDENNCVNNYGLTNPGWYPFEKMWGWTATDDDLSNDVVLPFGSGAIITSGEADTTVTFAGQVLGQKTYPLYGGAINWTGNATPVGLTLGDFAIPTDQSFMSGDSIVLEIWGEDGTLQGSYSFVDENNCVNNYGLTNPGWYPFEKMWGWTATDDDLSNDIPVASGQMVIITSGEADTTLTLPDPTKVTPPAAK